MGIFFALMVFLYPLGMLFITPASFIALLIQARGKAGVMFVRGLVLTGILVLVLGPSIVKTGSGSFALPWWLPQSGITEYYVWHYTLACITLLMLCIAAVSIYRAFVPLAASHNSQPEPAHSSQITEAILAAIQSFRAGEPVSQPCAACGSLIRVEPVGAATGQRVVLQISCECKQCNGRLSV